MLTNRLIRALCIYLLLGFLFLGTSAGAEVLNNTVVVAKNGDRSPDNTGNLSLLRDSVVQNGGQPAFSGDLQEGGSSVGSGLFRGDGSPGSLQLLVRSGQPSPDGNGNFVGTGPPLINDSGSVAFGTVFENTFGGFEDENAIVIGSGTPATLKIIVRGGKSAPNGAGVFGPLPGPSGVNNRGQVVVVTPLTNLLIGIFRGDGTPGSLTTIMLSGQTTPGGDGQYIGPVIFLPAALNESGQVAFVSSVRGSDTKQWMGVFRGDGANPTRQIVREEDMTPSGNGRFDSIARPGGPFSNLPLNDNGKVAFVAGLEGTSGGSIDNAGIFMGDETGLVEVVRRGNLAPDGNGRFLDFFTKIYLNNTGQVFFLASLTGASGGATTGLFRGSGGAVTQLARTNGPAPGGGLFNEFLAVLGLNRLGQALFSASVNLLDGGPTSDQFGLFFYDGTALHSVARVGDTIPNHGVITALRVTDPFAEGSESGALNDLGQVTYNFSAGGIIGIALWTKSLIFNDGFESGNLSFWSSTP